eukprot:3311833-Amphidinium_carterae.1
MANPCVHWFGRVPSSSNPADSPSRGKGVDLEGPWRVLQVSPACALECVWRLAQKESAVGAS